MRSLFILFEDLFSFFKCFSSKFKEVYVCAVCLCMYIKVSSPYCLACIVIMSAGQDDSRELMM